LSPLDKLERALQFLPERQIRYSMPLMALVCPSFLGLRQLLKRWP
jgi:hypothetical protein